MLMKVYKKNKVVKSKAQDEAPKKSIDAEVKAVDKEKAEDGLEEDFADEINDEEMPTVTLSEDEINQLKDVLPTLIENLPKIIQLLTGEATIEIIDEEASEVEDSEVEEEVIEEEVEEDVEVEFPEVEEEEEKADDAVPFNADEVLNDPAKREAIEKALAAKKTTKVEDSKAEDEKADDEEVKAEDKDAVDSKPVKKTFVKKTLNKKARDKKVKKVNPNAELVETPVERKAVDAAPEKRTFDFHKKK
jgi:hypothetical protein